MTPKEYIPRDAVIGEIERRIMSCVTFYTIASQKGGKRAMEEIERTKSHYESLLSFVKELEIKKL